MKKILAPLIAFNIILIPILVYIHLQGECTLLNQVFGSVPKQYCDSVKNIWLNIAYANGFYLLVLLFGSSPKGGGGGGGASKPSGGGSSGGGSHGGGH